MRARTALVPLLAGVVGCHCGAPLDTGDGGALGGKGGTAGQVTSITGGTVSTGGVATTGVGAAGSGTAGDTGTAGTGGTGGVAPFCGDGQVDPGEACDDGNDTDSDACSSDCVITVMLIADDIAEWPGVIATGHDGGQGFLVTWRGGGPFGLTAAPVSAKGTVTPPELLIPGLAWPRAVALPDNQALILTRNDAHDAVMIDATTLDVNEQLAPDFPPGGLHIPLVANDLAEVATAVPMPWDAALQQQEVQGCIVHPTALCHHLADSKVKSVAAIAERGDGFVAAVATSTGFDLVTFDAMGVTGTVSVDEPVLSVDPYLARRPGGFVLVWPSDCLRYRFFDDDLQPLGPSQVVQDSCPQNLFWPRVAVGPTGRFAIAYWTGETGLNGWYCIGRGVVVEADGASMGSAFVLRGDEDSCTSDVHVAANPAGDALFVWNYDDYLFDLVEAKLFPGLLE